MKKILMAMVFVIPLFLVNNVKAQDSELFQTDVTVTTQYSCPSHGQITGQVPGLNTVIKEYNGPDTYTLVFNAGFEGTRPCTADVKTDTNSQGQYCEGIKTKNLSVSPFNNIDVELDLIGTGGSGGNQQ